VLFVKKADGKYSVLTGNETGILLTHYILSSLDEMKILPKNAAIVKTIVTTEAAEKNS
jgi:phosphoglucomutase